MNVVMIIPTGIGCEIGGHAGDATPAARLLGACCDKLILHPNVVNASDINEMPSNALYVEGSILDRFLENKIELQEVRQNKILVVTNSPIHNETINAVSAARVTLGIDVEIVVLKYPLRMRGEIKDGIATGYVENHFNLIEQVQNYKFDALAIATPIDVETKVKENYFENGGVNPWGGVEAIVSKLIAEALNKPVAHAPVCMDNKATILFETDIIVDPRMAAEIVSYAFLHCVLKGLHKAPRINNDVKRKGLGVEDIDFMVSPYGCWGRPHNACFQAGLPIIVIRENKTIYHRNYSDDECIIVENYLEAAGYIMAAQAGIHPLSVRRPLKSTKINNLGL